MDAVLSADWQRFNWTVDYCPSLALAVVWINGRLDFGCFVGDDAMGWRWAGGLAA